jgi:membrane-associated phospholipid phosphatase
MSAETTSRARRGAPALQDLIIAGYMLVLAAIWWARSPAPGLRIATLVACVVVLPAAGFVARAVPEIPRWARINLYRVVAVGSLVWGYLVLEHALPAVRPDAVDASLAAVDERLFGGQPVLWLERYNRLPVVEWMSFFYFDYHPFILAQVIGVLWIQRSPRARDEFGLGVAIVFCAGYLGYLAVPALGPEALFGDRFHEPLHGGPFLRLVASSVDATRGMKDVFPSLHTGGSTLLALFSVRRASLDRRWRVPAALTCFFAVNVIASTLILRRHYAIDVLAGLALGACGALAAARLAPWEEARRRRLGRAPVWPDA